MGCYISRIWEEETRQRIASKFSMVIGIPDVITCIKFGVDRLRGLRLVRGQISPFPIYFAGRPQNTVWERDGGIESPFSLCLDESRNRLYVGELLGANRVLVFDGVKFWCTRTKLHTLTCTVIQNVCLTSVSKEVFKSRLSSLFRNNSVTVAC